MALTEKLGNIADAIRGKTGKTDAMTLDQMVTEIAGIQTMGGGDDATVAGLLECNLEELFNEAATVVATARICQNNTTLKKVNLPNVKSMVAYVFAGCTSLTEVILPNVERIYMSTFDGCTALTELEFPLVDGLYNNGNMKNCINLRKVVFGRKKCSTNYISQWNFQNCTSLETIVIKSEKVWELKNINNFEGSTFAEGGTGGTVYVPQALIEQYQQATNWSTLYAAGTCNFVAIEGSEYE